MENLCKTVRSYQNQIKIYGDKEIFASSLANYGVVPEKESICNQLFPDNVPTYTELLLLVLNHMKQPSYLEIGVSLGKNLYPLISACSGTFCAIDAEKLNPRLYLEGQMSPPTEEESWNAALTDLDKFSEADKNLIPLFKSKTSHSKHMISKHKNGNILHYFQANLLDQLLWKKFPAKFNVILSDAWHVPGSVHNEIVQLIKNDSLESEFFILFDDINFGLEPAVTEGFKMLESRGCKMLFLNIQGWTVVDAPHRMAILTNIPSVIENSEFKQFLELQ